MKNTNTLREHPKDPLLTFQTVETQKLELIHCDLSIKSNTGKHSCDVFLQALGHNPDISTNQNI